MAPASLDKGNAMRLVNLSSLGDVLVLQTTNNDPDLERVYGYTKDKGSAIFPAFPPFLEWVVEDLRVIYKDELVFSADAAEHIAQASNERELPPSYVQRAPVCFDHQQKALEFAWRNPRAALFLDCGLGKTRVAIELLRALKSAGELRQALVVAPPRLVLNWQREMDKFAPGELTYISPVDHRSMPLPAEKRHQVYKGSADVWLISYSMLSADKVILETVLDPSILIVDESHYLRSPDSSRTGDVWDFAEGVHRRVILSGTPNLGDPRHLYGQLGVLAPFILGSKSEFNKRYLKTDPRNKRIVTGYKNLDVLADIVSTVAIRLKKEDCLDMNLPDRQIIDIPVGLDPESKKYYNDAVAMDDLSIPDGRLAVGVGAAQRVSRLLQILAGFVYLDMRDPYVCDGCTYLAFCEEETILPYTNQCKVHPKKPAREVYDFRKSPRLEALETLLESICANQDNKVLVWYVHDRERDLIATRVEKLGLKAVYYATDGQAAVDALNSDPSVQIMVSQIGTGVGYTANSANYAVYYAVSWELDHYQQSLDRNHRPGQRRAVTVYRLRAEGTAQDALFEALDNKKTVAETLTDCVYCGTCKSYAACSAQKIKAFGEGCKYSPTIARKVTKVKRLTLEEEDYG